MWDARAAELRKRDANGGQESAGSSAGSVYPCTAV